MSDIPSKQKLDEYVKLGLLRSQTHPTLPLTIYVYSEFTTFERLWNNVTMAARGLVVDDKGRCVVRCMSKFFNEDEPHAMCGKPSLTTPMYFEKLDGSLIQVVNDAEYGLVITSKGSFASDQSAWAKQIIEEKYDPSCFASGVTYVFELIHPENRIVLDYGKTRELYLLTIIKTDTGEDYGLWDVEHSPFNCVQTVKDIDSYMERNDVEGVVVKTGQHRYKVKTGEYIRLHRIVTEFTEKRVWEALRDGSSLEFENMPEEFQKWLDDTVSWFTTRFNIFNRDARIEFEFAKTLTDKELGLSKHFKHKSMVFALRNNKPIDQMIWKLIKPKKEVSDETNNA